MRSLIIGVVLLAMGLCANGQVVWQRTYGGWGHDEGHGVRETADGGFIVVGSTGSFGAGSSDVYLLKLDAQGEREWSRTLGWAGVDQGRAVRQLEDGGYIVAGYTQDLVAGGYNGLLARFDGFGQLLWWKAYGDAGWDFLYDVEVLSDGFVAVGSNTLQDEAHAWMIRTDADGAVVWEVAQGEAGLGEARSVRVTSGGHMVFAGTSPAGDDGNHALVALCTPSGTVEWRTELGNGPDDKGYSVVEGPDGGFVVGGTSSFGNGYDQMLFAKVDGAGEPVWLNHVDAPEGDLQGYSIRVDYGGGLVLAGATSSYGGGGYDFYLAHTDAFGFWQSGPTYGGPGDEVCRDMDLVSDGGYVLVGSTDGFGPGTSAVFVVKSDGEGMDGSVEEGFDPLRVNAPAKQEAGLALWPNPVSGAHGMVFLKGELDRSTGWQAVLFAADGREVGVFIGTPGQDALILPRIAGGTYFLRFIQGRTLAVLPLVVQPE